MKDKFSFVFVYWWMLILLIFGTGLMLFAEKEERVSETEKRTLSGFPELNAQTLFSGDFFTGIEDYLSDGVFARDEVVGVSDDLLGLFSRTTPKDELLLNELEMAEQVLDGGGEGGDATEPEQAAEQPDAAAEDTQTDGNSSEEAEQDAFTVSDKIEGYGFWLEGSNGEYVNLVKVPEGRIEQVAETLNRFKSYLPDDGNVFYTNVPRADMAQMLQKSGEYTGWYENTGEGMSKYIENGVYYVNAPALLEEDILAGKTLYFTSDHHWNPYGAIHVVNECLRLQGLPTIAYDSYKYKINRFINSRNNTDDELALLYPLQDVNGRIMDGDRAGGETRLLYYDMDNYYAFLYGDTREWTQYDTGFSTGRNALVIGDSYSNCFLPYLMPYYDRVNKVDIRHYNQDGDMKYTLSELIEVVGIDDVYVVVTHLNGVSGVASYERLGWILDE